MRGRGALAEACGRAFFSRLAESPSAASVSSRCMSNVAQDASRSQSSSLMRLAALFRDYNKLAKGKLTALVVATSAAGFVAGSDETVDYRKLAWTSLGTAACSAAANALNQIYEVNNDSMMRRTMMRPLPAGRMSRAHALAFAAVMGCSGAAMLAAQTNTSTAALGLGNILLYAAVYTPLKQVHHLNTWVGAVVGAVPPIMGWTAATGSIDPGALFMGSVLYFWQLPHFLALAWMGKEDYSRGGYRMLSLLDTTGKRTAACALRNALYLLPLGLVASGYGMVGNAFVYESFALSGVMALSASRFYSAPSQQTARLLFRASLIHLPLFLIFYILHRQPNDGSLTWDALLSRLGGLQDSAATSVQAGNEPRHQVPLGLMIFPFSPPVTASACVYKAVTGTSTSTSVQTRVADTERLPDESADDGRDRKEQL